MQAVRGGFTTGRGPGGTGLTYGTRHNNKIVDVHKSIETNLYHIYV